MTIKNQEQENNLRICGKYLAEALEVVKQAVRPGISTRELDEIAEREIRARKGIPSFKDYRTHGTEFSYPASLCVSINDEVVHGIPSERKLQTGDIVGLDIGMEYEGIFTDMAVTLSVGEVSQELRKLLAVTQESLEVGIAEVRAGNRVGDIGAAIEAYVKPYKFGIVKELVGHGVGNSVHEEPEIPNWGTPGTGSVLKEGMVVALEPMLTIGSPRVYVTDDGWVWKTKDGKPAAHFEHTVLITKDGPEIITKI